MENVQPIPRLEDIHCRPTRSEDFHFLLRVYASTREEEMALVDWSEEEKVVFLQMQFEAQDKWYRENYAGAEYSTILFEEEPIGRLYLARWTDEIRIIDIALLPEFRCRGIGSTLLGEILAEGESLKKKVTIHVERFNRALRMYTRLGFELKEDKGVYLLLEWTPK